MPQLRVVGPDGSEQLLDLQGEEFILGRDPQTDIPLQDRKVSRRHARIVRRGSDYYVEDMESANGVLVGGRPIRKAVQLTSGSVFEIGPFTLRFAADPAPGAKISFSLIGLSGPVEGKTFLLPVAELSVGRGDESDVQIPDGSISRNHATLDVQQNRLTVKDLGSSNGTYVNNERVAKEPLHNGDLVRFGSVEFEVSVEGAGKSKGPRQLPAWVQKLRRADSSVKLAAAMGTMTVVLLVVVIAMLVMRGGSSASAGPDPFAAYEKAVEVGLSNANTYLEKESWDKAVTLFQDVLDQDPICEEARQGLQIALQNREHEALLALARAALSQGRPHDALSNLSGVPGDAHYAQVAGQLAAQARAALAHGAVGEARAACARKEWRACHQNAVTALTYQSELTEARTLVTSSEAAMREKKMPFAPWEP